MIRNLLVCLGAATWIAATIPAFAAEPASGEHPPATLDTESQHQGGGHSTGQKEGATSGTMKDPHKDPHKGGMMGGQGGGMGR